MSCVRAAPTAAPAMRPATRSTVMAAGNTSVGEHDGTAQGVYEQLGHGPGHCPYLPPTLLPSLPSFGAGDGTQTYSTDFLPLSYTPPTRMPCLLNPTYISAPHYTPKYTCRES